MKFDTLNCLSTMVCGAGLLTLTACSNGTEMGVGDAAAVDSAYAALVAEAAACGRALDECMDEAGDDMAAISSCSDELAACTSAKGPALERLGQVARECAHEKNACVETAMGDGAAIMDCISEMHACIGEAKPVRADLDAGVGGGRPAGKDMCLDSLLSCIEEDEKEPPVCAEDARGCLMAMLPNPAAAMTDEKPDMPGKAAVMMDGDDDAEPLGGTSKGQEVADEHDEDAAASDEPGDAQAKGNGAGQSKAEEQAAMADAASGGAEAKARGEAMKACLEELRLCMEAGDGTQDCAASLRVCRDML